MKSDVTFEKIRVRLTKVSEEEKRTVQHIFKFVIKVNGEVKKTWVLDLKSLKLFMGDDPNVECTLTVDDEDMFNLGNGTLTTQEALAKEKLDIDGNIELALKLAPFVASL